MESEGSRCFLHRAARMAFGVIPAGASCAAELQIISLVLCSFSFNCCWQRGRAEVEISMMRGTTPSQRPSLVCRRRVTWSKKGNWQEIGGSGWQQDTGLAAGHGAGSPAEHSGPMAASTQQAVTGQGSSCRHARRQKSFADCSSEPRAGADLPTCLALTQPEFGSSGLVCLLHAAPGCEALMF